MGLRPSTASSWIEATPTNRDVDVVWPVFRQLMPRILDCRFDKDGNAVRKSISTSRKHLEVFRVAQSQLGEKLIGTRISRRFAECDGVESFGSDLWFFYSAKTPQPRTLPIPSSLGGWSFSQMLIEAGDFDGDGKVEALFWFAGYNEDGYIIYFDDFRKSEKFTWGYH